MNWQRGIACGNPRPFKLKKREARGRKQAKRVWDFAAGKRPRRGEYKPKARIDAFEKRTRRARSGVSNGLRMQTRVNFVFYEA